MCNFDAKLMCNFDASKFFVLKIHIKQKKFHFSCFLHCFSLILLEITLKQEGL